jgi:Zn ribbon nucleic-acid-binding protein
VSRRAAEDRQVSIEVAWCPACQADCTVEIVALVDDPGPVAICVDCGLGVETWWLAGLLATTHEADRADRGVRAS